MATLLRSAVALLVLAAPLSARPETDRDRARRLTWEGASLYGLAVLQQRDDRLVAACRTLEEAARLDPTAAAPRAALIPLYTALGRPTDAATAAEAVVALDPSQGSVWLTLARLRHELGQTAAAVAALKQCAAHPALAGDAKARAAAHRELGRLQETGDAAAAVAAYAEALRLLGDAASPAERAELAEGCGRAATRAGKHADATAAFNQAKTWHAAAGDRARAARVDFLLAGAAAAAQDWPRANTLLDRYLAARPRDLEAYRLKARALREGVEEGAPLFMLEGYVRAQPDFLPLRVLLADEYRRQGQLGRAESLYRAVVAETPDVPAYRGLFAAMTAAGRPNDALQLLDDTFRRAAPDPDEDPNRGRPMPEAVVTDRAAARHVRAMVAALRQEPEAVRALLPAALSELRGRRWRQPASESLQILAELAETADQLADAEELLRNSLFRGGGRGGGFGRQSDVYYPLYRVLWKARKPDAVLRLSQDGLSERGRANVFPVLHHYHAARAHLALGRGDAALASADEAVKAGGTDSLFLTAHILRTEVLVWLGRFDQAEADAKKLLPEFPAPGDTVRVRRALANVYTEARRFDRAEEELRQALELAPDDASLHNALGYQLADEGRNLDEADRLIRRALELDRELKLSKKDHLADAEENAAYLDSLGWVRFRQGRHAEARDLLAKAAALPEGAIDPVVWDHLGDAHARLGQLPQAAKAWAEATRLYATDRRARTDARAAEVRRKLERVTAKP